MFCLSAIEGHPYEMIANYLEARRGLTMYVGRMANLNWRRTVGLLAERSIGLQAKACAAMLAMR